MNKFGDIITVVCSCIVLCLLQSGQTNAFCLRVRVRSPFNSRVKDNWSLPRRIIKYGTSEVHMTSIKAPAQRYSSNDWFISLMTLHKSRILRRIQSHLIFSICWTFITTFLYKTGRLALQVSNPLPWSLLASVLSLLLVFRTNSAYDRFWEGLLVRNVRDISSSLSSRIPAQFQL
jgi:hypothetical protein